MVNPAYDIYKRDGFGARAWVESARDLQNANRRIIELSADSPGKYVVVSRANGQMVGGGMSISSGASNAPRQESQPQAANRAKSAQKISSHEVPSHADPESETLWR